jgi:glycine cleavage system protein P-like pyridoxal-binding family
MKTFQELKEKLGRHPSGQMVFNKKIKNIPVMIHKETSGFVVYIDGDRLDSYKTQKQAEQSAVQIVSQLKGK